MFQSHRDGLAVRIYVAFLIAAVVPTAVAGVIGVWLSLDRLRGATVSGLQQEVSARGQGVSARFETLAVELRFFATNPQAMRLLALPRQTPSAEAVQLQAILGEQYERMAKVRDDVYQIRLLDQDGHERVRVDRRPQGVFVATKEQLQDKRDRYYFREALQRPAGALFVSPLDLNVEHGVVEWPQRPVVRLATAVVGKDGHRSGVVIINLHARVLLEPVQQMVQDRDGVAYLFDRASQFLSRDGRSEAAEFKMRPISELVDIAPETLKQLLSDRVGHRNDGSTLWAHAPVQFADGASAQGAPRWVMAIAFPERVLLAQVLDLSRLYLVLLVALTLAAAAGYRLSKRLIGPLQALTAEADALADGDLGRRVRVEGSDEIARLGHRFNAMAARLQGTLQELESQRRGLEVEVSARTSDLAAERARLAAVLRHASDAITAIGADGTVLFANLAAQQLIGLPGEPRADTLAALVGNRSPGQSEVPIGPSRWSVRRDVLAVRDVLAGSSGSDVVVVARDVTEERRLQDEKRDFDRHLAQQDKLATFGELAMGLAHEIGNPLAGMKAVVQTLLADESLVAEMIDDLRRLEDEIDRLSSFLKSFRGMAVPQAPLLSDQALGAAVEDMLFWIRKPARVQGVTIHTELDLALGPLKADPAQLRQVLLNLLVNALQAMPAGGTLFVRARADGAMARVEIRDTGHGVPGVLQAQVFKPFFTTRTDGTGLGLAVCAKVVEDHAGRIELISRPGDTCFTIYWPLSDGTGHAP
ncbi:MAG: ATP-binding protein [Aquabacterium commune]|uniref:ATP-binding protein n=1 Tax=Aquabacterium commune TaxID=70586 RepID=UPI003BB205D6